MCNDDGYDQSVNTEDTRHDNRHNVLDDTFGMVDTHLANAQASSPGSPGGTPTGENHTTAGAKISAANVDDV